MQFADKHDCRDIFITTGNHGELVQKIIDVRLEAALSHFYGEEVVAILLCFLVGAILGENYLGYLLKLWIKRGGRE